MDEREEFEEFYDCPEISGVDQYEYASAKEKASVLWLLSKAFQGNIPEDLMEPFYRDQDNIRRLKPKIVHSLATAELYCLALTNIYADPNYSNLDHHGILQVLSRKGVTLQPHPTTTLVQTAPIRMNAHMAIIEGIMSLYIKEILIPDKIVEVVKKFSNVDVNNEKPSNCEQAAVLWINKCCKSLEREIRTECTTEDERRLPKIPVLQELTDLSDGCCIAAVISYYCPNYFRWKDICWNSPISLGDSIHNLQLVKRFCSEFLPRSICFLSMEDLLYLHPSIRDNVLVFVADLLYAFVIAKSPCVTRRSHSSQPSLPLENSKSLSNFQSHKTPAVCSPIPNLRSDSYGGSTSSLPDIRPGSRVRNCGSKERLCEKVLTKKSSYPDEMVANELQRTSSIGVVNGWKTTNLPHVASTDSVGSSRNMNPELSRLPAEGESHQSQPSICSAGDSAVPKSIAHSSRTTLCSQNSPIRESFGLRKSSEPNYRDNGLGRTRKGLDDYYTQLAGSEGPLRSVSTSNIIENGKKKGTGIESIPGSSSSQSSGICLSDVDVKNGLFSTTSFAQLSKHRDSSSSSINITYTPNEKDDKEQHCPLKGSNTNVKRVDGEKKTTFATLPTTTTTWQAQHHASHSSFPQTDSGHETPTEPQDHLLNAHLHNLRMKLEDQKRKIELKKKRMEMMWKRQRQKLGKAAFLQAVSKGTGSGEAGTPDSGTGKDDLEFQNAGLLQESNKQAIASPSLVKRMSMHEIAADLDNVQKKWLNQADVSDQIFPETTVDASTVDEVVNIDLQATIMHLNTSLTDLQADISRISLQQEQVESLMMKDSIDDGSHFYLHAGEPSFNVCGLPPAPTACWNMHETSGAKLGMFSAQQNFVSSTPYSPQKKQPLPPEELYSKVIKPEHRKNQQGLVAINDSPKKQGKHPSSGEIHIVLPQVPDSKSSDKQGFYVPLEKEARKPNKPKGQKKNVVPNQVFVKNVPSSKVEDSNSLGFVIGADLVHPDPDTENEMARKKELIMNLSIQRKAEYERKRAHKEREYSRIKEEEQRKQERQERKREEEKRRRDMILEQYRQRKVQEELEKEGLGMPKEVFHKMPPKSRTSIYQVKRNDNRLSSAFSKPAVVLRNHVNSMNQNRRESKPRPKSAYVHANSDLSSLLSMDIAASKRNSQFFPGRDFDLDSLNSGSTASSQNHRHSLFMPNDGPNSDGASDTASNGSSADYTGPKLFVKPAAKSNRGIIINAINTVLAGAVNAETKRKVLEEMNVSESKHFLILFRDAGCQFRALYTYNPEREEVTKLYGIGPKNILDKMMDRFYKYNSGGKCFSEIQTKHLTVTIDAFTIPNSLWAGKKVVPPKKEFF